jgi:hypothetical protein
MLTVLMDVSARAQQYLQRFASLPRTTTSNQQLLLLSSSRVDLRTIAVWWPIFAAAKLSIINDAPLLPCHKGQFAGDNVCRPRQLGR